MRLPIQPRYSDYDAKGHVNNAVYLTYFELARIAAWRAASGREDADFIVARAEIDYRSPAMLGEPLEVEVTTREVRTKAWVWRYRVTVTGTERLVAEGETVQVMYDYAAHATVAIPDGLRAGLGSV